MRVYYNQRYFIILRIEKGDDVMREPENKTNTEQKPDKKKIIALVLMLIAVLLVMVLSLIVILRKTDDTDIKERADTKQIWIDKLSSAEVTTEKQTAKAEAKKTENITSSTKKSDEKNVTADKNNKKSSAKTDVDTKTSKGSKSSAQNTTEKSVKTSSDRTVQDATTESTTQNAAGGVTESATQEATTERRTERATQEATTERRTERATQEAVTERRTESTTERTTECQHDWVAQTKTEKVLVEEGWDEDVYKISSKCAYCDKDTSDGTHDPGLCGELVYDPRADEWFHEGAAEVSYQKYVKTIHHPDVYEDKTVTTGYVCSKCGAKK